MNSWIHLSMAIVAEIIATSALKARRASPACSLAGHRGGLRDRVLLPGPHAAGHPGGVAYAIWSGVGIVLISLVGALLFKQHLDLPAIIGIALILAGVVVMNVFSKSVGH